MTLQTVADKVGVSRMTVSNAFSRPDQLSAELRDRILAAAEELGYVPVSVTAYDLFPLTHHMECIAILAPR